MNIQLVHTGRIPVIHYGGTERVIWYLGRELARMGHRVSFLAAAGSTCDFAEVRPLDPARPKEKQLDPAADIVHFQEQPAVPVEAPHVVTIHGNVGHTDPLDLNCVFVSADHAARHGSRSFVYNGLDWDDYGRPDLGARRGYYHFLGKAAWRVKNVQGAIDTIRTLPGERLAVLGGTRLNLKMGFRLTLSPRVRFYGMVGGERKNRLLQGSKGLVFPCGGRSPSGWRSPRASGSAARCSAPPTARCPSWYRPGWGSFPTRKPRWPRRSAGRTSTAKCATNTPATFSTPGRWPKPM